MRETIEAELADVRAQLRAHMASWEYAYAMAAGPDSGREHPVHWATRARTEQLLKRCRDLEARLSEHDL